MSTITVVIVVQVPVRLAYDQWTRFDTFPSFMEGVQQVRALGDGQHEWTVEVVGVTRRFVTETVSEIPDRLLAWRTVDGDVGHVGSLTFEPLRVGATRVSLTMELEPHGVLESAGDRLGFVSRRISADLRRFKDFVEADVRPLID